MLKCGVGVYEYWDLTLEEIQLIVKSFSEKAKPKNRDNIYLSYNTAALTAAFVGSSMNGKNIPSFEELYPELISDDDKNVRNKQEVEAYKNKWKAFMIVHNKQGKGD